MHALSLPMNSPPMWYCSMQQAVLSFTKYSASSAQEAAPKCDLDRSCLSLPERSRAMPKPTFQ